MNHEQHQLINSSHGSQRYVLTAQKPEPANMTFVRTDHFKEPMFDSIWDCFTVSHSDLQELLLCQQGATNMLEFEYSQIRDKL